MIVWADLHVDKGFGFAVSKYYLVLNVVCNFKSIYRMIHTMTYYKHDTLSKYLGKYFFGVYYEVFR